MKNEKVSRWWAVAAILVVVVLAVVALGLGLLSNRPAAAAQASSQSLTVQWKPQTVAEAKLLAKVEADNELLLKKLKDMAASPETQNPEQWAKEFSGTYLKKPRLWADDAGHYVDWGDVFKKLREVVGGKPDVRLDNLHILIEYLPYVEGRDYDLLANIKISFSCAAGEDPILEGELSHRKVCVWEP